MFFIRRDYTTNRPGAEVPGVLTCLPSSFFHFHGINSLGLENDQRLFRGTAFAAFAEPHQEAVGRRIGKRLDRTDFFRIQAVNSGSSKQLRLSRKWENQAQGSRRSQDGGGTAQQIGQRQGDLEAGQADGWVRAETALGDLEKGRVAKDGLHAGQAGMDMFEIATDDTKLSSSFHSPRHCPRPGGKGVPGSPRR